jgi:hypothetical protein
LFINYPQLSIGLTKQYESLVLKRIDIYKHHSKAAQTDVTDGKRARAHAIAPPKYYAN